MLMPPSQNQYAFIPCHTKQAKQGPFLQAVSHLRLLPRRAALPRLCQPTDPNGTQNPEGPQPRELATRSFPLARLEFQVQLTLPGQSEKATSPRQRADPATQSEVSRQVLSRGDPRKTLSAPGLVPAQPRPGAPRSPALLLLLPA